MTAHDVDLFARRGPMQREDVERRFLDFTPNVALLWRLCGDNHEKRSRASLPRTVDPFEQEVGDELERRGLTIHRQIGCGGYPHRPCPYVPRVRAGNTYSASSAMQGEATTPRQPPAIATGSGTRSSKGWAGGWKARVVIGLGARSCRPDRPCTRSCSKRSAKSPELKHPHTGRPGAVCALHSTTSAEGPETGGAGFRFHREGFGQRTEHSRFSIYFVSSVPCRRKT